MKPGASNTGAGPVTDSGPDETDDRAGDSVPVDALSSPDVSRSGDSPIYAFISHPTLIDFPGHLAAVFFTSGCNFRCGFCHNPDLLRTRQKGITWQRLEEVCRQFSADWTTAAVISGGEPTLAPELPELLTFFRTRGWKIKLDTNGSRPEVLARVLPDVDYVALDVKAGPDRYEELTGFRHVEKVTESIDLVLAHDRAGFEYELRTTLIESFHDDAQIEAIGEMIRGARRYVVQAFIPRDGMPDAGLRAEPRTSPERLYAVEAKMSEFVDEVLIRGE